MHASKYKVHQLPPRYTRLKLPGSWIVRLWLSSADHLLLLQAWGAVTTWATDDRLLTAGTIAQGLTPAELSSMSITLQDLEALGQYAGWTPEQVRPFTSSSWLCLLRWISSWSSFSSAEYLPGPLPSPPINSLLRPRHLLIKVQL